MVNLIYYFKTVQGYSVFIYEFLYAVYVLYTDYFTTIRLGLAGDHRSHTLLCSLRY